jgi:hypothetical protein
MSHRCRSWGLFVPIALFGWPLRVHRRNIFFDLIKRPPARLARKLTNWELKFNMGDNLLQKYELLPESTPNLGQFWRG